MISTFPGSSKGSAGRNDEGAHEQEMELSTQTKNEKFGPLLSLKQSPTLNSIKQFSSSSSGEQPSFRSKKSKNTTKYSASEKTKKSATSKTQKKSISKKTAKSSKKADNISKLKQNKSMKNKLARARRNSVLKTPSLLGQIMPKFELTEEGTSFPFNELMDAIKAETCRSHVAKDAVVAVSQLTAMFVNDLCKKSLARAKSRTRDEICYDDVAEVVNSSIKHVFLWDIIPKRTSQVEEKENAAQLETKLKKRTERLERAALKQPLLKKIKLEKSKSGNHSQSVKDIFPKNTSNESSINRIFVKESKSKIFPSNENFKIFCNVCSVSFTQNSSWKRHNGTLAHKKQCLKQTNRIIIEDTKPNEIFPPNENHKIFCNVCSVSFTQKSSWKRHNGTLAHKKQCLGQGLQNQCRQSAGADDQ